MFMLKFATDSAQFDNGSEDNPRYEEAVGEVLAAFLAARPWYSDESGTIRDVNGNTIGEWEAS